MTPFAREMLELRRNEQPKRLYWAWRRGEIDVELLREWILDVWQAAEWPVSALGHGWWLEMFAATGFVTDGCDEPAYPVTVYRGAALTHARGFSWTWDPYRAAWFAERTALFGFPAAIWEVTLPRDRLLATIGGVEGRNEREVIVNPRRLRGRWSPRKLRDVDVGGGR